MTPIQHTKSYNKHNFAFEANEAVARTEPGFMSIIIPPESKQMRTLFFFSIVLFGLFNWHVAAGRLECA